MPARFEMLAETPGTYPLVLVDEDRRIGSLEIREGALARRDLLLRAR